MSGSDQEWEKYKKSLLDTIRALTFPKTIYYENKINQTDKTKIDNFIANEEYFNIPIIIDKAKYFIDMHVEAHILGVLWILTIGKIIEEGFYEDSYGNRLDKKLSNEAFKKFSPYLFKPYFFQYESWRRYWPQAC